MCVSVCVRAFLCDAQQTFKYARLGNARRGFYACNKRPQQPNKMNQTERWHIPLSINQVKTKSSKWHIKTSPRHAPRHRSCVRLYARALTLPFSLESNFYSIFFIYIHSHVLLLKSEKNDIASG